MSRQLKSLKSGSANIEPEPMLAATYKLLKYLEDEWEDCDSTSDAWQVLGAIRQALGQSKRQMDGVTYAQMRRFIGKFASTHDLK